MTCDPESFHIHLIGRSREINRMETHKPEPAMPITVIDSRETYDDLVQQSRSGDKILIIKATATWCGPCRTIAPEYKALSDEKSKRFFLFAELDVDEHAELAAELGVEGMPTFVKFYRGELVNNERVVGASMDRVRALVQ